MFSTKASAGYRRILWAALGATSTALFATNAAAADEPPQKIVSYADLDLSKQQDAAALYARLERAASVVCRSFDGQQLDYKRMKQECEQAALSAAVEQIDSEYVTAVHEADPRVRVAQHRAIAAPRT